MIKENKNPDKETLERWHKDPTNWIWGLFYYNKSDPRLLPPKRIAAMGWTINFANPKSIGVIALLLIFLFLLIGIISN